MKYNSLTNCNFCRARYSLFVLNVPLNSNQPTNLISCGRLSWLPSSFLLHVKYTLSYHIISRLQCLARVVAGNRIPGSNLATLSHLHWLPVYDRIKFKIVNDS